jgi:mannose-6-phosphate isomerase-like protein (cupin superfamily)
MYQINMHKKRRIQMNFQNLTEEKILEMLEGIEGTKEIMPNGETRTRYISNEIYCVKVEYPATITDVTWQNAHFHQTTTETWYIASGRQYVAEKHNGKIKIIIMNAGDVFTSTKGIEHNCALVPGSTTYTFKEKDEGTDFDWLPASDDFDRLSKSLNFEM